MSYAFLDLTDPEDGEPTIIRADQIAAFYGVPAKVTARIFPGGGGAVCGERDAYTRVVLLSGNAYNVAESVRSVTAKLGLALRAMDT